LELLSLDFIRPVYVDLGVGVEWQESLRGLARDALLGTLGSGPPRLQPLPHGESVSFFLATGQPFLDTFQRAFGPQPTERVRFWVEYVLCQEDCNPWVLYERLFARWQGTYRHTGVDEFGFQSEAPIVLSKLREVDAPAASGRLAKQRNSALSEWDFKLFSKMGLLEIPEDSDFFPFVDAILLAISMRRFQHFWRWLASFAGSASVGSIAAAAERLATEKRMPPCDPSALPRHPSDV
jgi:hypothetical protein